MKDDRCPRCDGGRLKGWDKLTDEEQQVVLRLPDAAAYPPAERRARHRWCTRCWYEATEGSHGTA